jgi:hypothetical protein
MGAIIRHKVVQSDLRVGPLGCTWPLAIRLSSANGHEDDERQRKLLQAGMQNSGLPE